MLYCLNLKLESPHSFHSQWIWNSISNISLVFRYLGSHLWGLRVYKPNWRWRKEKTKWRGLFKIRQYALTQIMLYSPLYLSFQSNCQLVFFISTWKYIIHTSCFSFTWTIICSLFQQNNPTGVFNFMYKYWFLIKNFNGSEYYG